MDSDNSFLERISVHEPRERERVDSISAVIPTTGTSHRNGGASKTNKKPSTTSSVDKGKNMGPEIQVGDCLCCGTVVSYPSKTKKFRCSICSTTNISGQLESEACLKTKNKISLSEAKTIVQNCIRKASEASNSGNAKSRHEAFEEISQYSYDSFSNYHIVNNSFRSESLKRVHYSKSGLNLREIREFFNMLVCLPTRRPLFNALSGAVESLKRVDVRLEVNPAKIFWLLILLEIPFLSKCLIPVAKKESDRTMLDTTEIRSLCYEILKRTIGLLSHSSTFCNNYFTSWYSRLSTNDFSQKVDLINLYITYHLKHYYYLANTPQKLGRGAAPKSKLFSQDYLDEDSIKRADILNDEDKIKIRGSAPQSYLHGGSQKAHNQDKDNKVKIYQYNGDWRLKTGSMFLSLLIKANTIRSEFEKLSMSSFYNSLVDFVNVRLDFDSWQSTRKSNVVDNRSRHPEIHTVISYIHGQNYPEFSNSSYFICGYPFLISLGGKISILEYEARRQMERKAEEAFINSLDKRIAIDTYFKVRVRREFIVQDSLRAIKLNSTHLKKSLRVQFINEPGIDAGGLKKEWFLFLTRALFSPEAGIFVNIEDSNYLWFNLNPVETGEMYYLFGAVLGLAIYNSTILNLKFPIALYKILLSKPLSFKDFEQLYPMVSVNLAKIRQYSEQEFESLGITFEATYKDLFGKIRTVNLIPNGSRITVSSANVDLYIEKYYKFFLFDGISDQILSFKSGFSNVMVGNALSLFSPEEIELLLCGSDEERLDLGILKSITKYVGWASPDDAKRSYIIEWFWEYLESENYKGQKKFLSFVTGSDRVPATGIQHLNLKISKLSSVRDTDRLPVAHTCFNELGIYSYSSKEKFFSKLHTAINESSGFGIR